MSKKEKALARLRQNPKHVRYEDIEIVLYRLGFVKRQKGTSHAIFTLGTHILTVPRLKPFVKATYVRKILEELDRIEELEDLEDTE